jgi:ATP-binding cassette, subfamily C, bacterial CydD
MRLSSGPLRQLGRALPTDAATATAFDLVAIGLAVAAGAFGVAALDRILIGPGTAAPAAPATMAALGASLGAWLATRARQRRATSIAVRTAAMLRSLLYEQLCRLGPGALVHHRTGQLESTLTDGVDELAGYYAAFVPRMWATVIGVTAAVAGLVVIDLAVGAMVAAAVALVVAAPVLTARAFGATSHRFAETIGATAAEYLDAIQGIATLQAFGASSAWGDRLHDQFQELAEDETALAAMSNMHLGFTSLGVAGGLAAAVAVAAAQTSHHHLTPAHLLWVSTLTVVALVLVMSISHRLSTAYRATAWADAIFAVLDARVAVADPDQAAVADSRRPRPATVGDGGGSVRFDHVTFRYGPDRAAVLDDVSLRVDRGELLAVVGPSGAGKSTLVSLLLRFFDPETGCITLDGRDVRSLPLRDLRRLVAVSFQDTYLFNRTVAQNLALARPDATPAQIRAAAEAANAHEFIDALPHGYDTLLGERGLSLSGGQRQRLAIARALVDDAPVLVLDEPTSSVDDVSEALITDALARLRRDKTMIVIAHRLTTVADADRVVVLDRGRIVEQGTPGDLRTGSGAFADLRAAQHPLGRPVGGVAT